MLQISYIRENRAHVLERLAVKNFKSIDLFDEIIRLDEARRQMQTNLDALAAEANKAVKQIGDLIHRGEKQQAELVKTNTAAFKKQIKVLEGQLHELEEQVQQGLLLLPNLPHSAVPRGTNADDNDLLLEKGLKPVLRKGALPHWELAAKYDIIDFELGTKIAGAGFPVYKGKGAKLQRALINFFLDQAEIAGYREIQPPIVVNEISGFCTGQLPDKEAQMYHVGLDNLYLIPTGEVPITNLYRDVILKEEALPIKNCGYTPCFRREAGSYGAHVRGLNRLHQFDKVEIVQLAHPDQSYQILEEMSSYVQHLLQTLELPYRVIRLCGGDMSFASALTFDMEVWCAVQARWLEVSSVSNFETFQSNRLKLRFKAKGAKPQLLHTLNGSALALPRIVASLLENNQTDKGIRIPQALVPYTKFEWID